MASVNLAIGGMTCAACVRRVEQAVLSVPGVRSARVSLATGQTTVEHDGTASLQALRAAVEDISYSFEPRRGVLAQVRAVLVALRGRALLIGAAAGLALLGLYLGLIALAQGWPHALEQFEQARPFCWRSPPGSVSRQGCTHAFAGATQPTPAAQREWPPAAAPARRRCSPAVHITWPMCCHS